MPVGAPAAASRATFVVPGPLGQPTGGYRYDAKMVDALRARGWTVTVESLPGHFPPVDDAAPAGHALDAALGRVVDGERVLVDGLALGGLPAVAERHARRLALIALVHHPLADETGLATATRSRLEASEARALGACRGIVTTSRFTARRLAALGVAPERVQVVEPGVARAPATGDPVRAGQVREQRLLCIGSLVPRKGQDVLVEALATLTTRRWRLLLVGDVGRDRRFAAQVRARVSEAGLRDRVRIAGVLSEPDLESAYAGADVLVVPSRYEGYGMVVTEALARGLPLVATRGGALADTVPPGCALQVAPGDGGALAAALRDFLERPALRRRLVAGALAARPRLADWTGAGERFAAALGRVVPSP